MAAEKFQNAVKMSINSNPHLLFICQYLAHFYKKVSETFFFYSSPPSGRMKRVHFNQIPLFLFLCRVKRIALAIFSPVIIITV